MAAGRPADQGSQAARASFNAVMTESRHALESRLQGYQLVLLGIQGLMQAKPDLDRAGFERYISELAPERNASQARAFSYARRVPYAQKERYESSVRAEGHARFAIRPPGERPEYVVIHYLAPFAGKRVELSGEIINPATGTAPTLRVEFVQKLAATCQ